MNNMPKKEINDYVFYKIVCLDNSVDLCYVGSTADFNKRRTAHKCRCYDEKDKSYNLKIYKTIRENGGWSNFKMVQLGTREQLTKRQADQVEEEYRIELKANMNSQRCFRTEEQLKEYNKDYHQEYHKANRDKILERQQNYRKANKDKIKESDQKYREANKDLINEKKKEKDKCECGCVVNKRNLSRHRKSKKHIDLINKLLN